MTSLGSELPAVPGLFERLVDPQRWLPALLEFLVWFAVPTVLVLVMVGIGFLVVGRGRGLVIMVHAAVAGALILVASVTIANIFFPIPRQASVFVVVAGLSSFVYGIRQRGAVRSDVLNLVGVSAAGSGLYRLRMGSTVGYDTFLYHGPVVEWMAREPVPLGLALVHQRLGNSNGLMLLMGAFQSPFGDWSHHALVEASVVALGFTMLAACFQTARAAGDGWAASFSLGLLIAGALYFAFASHEPGNDHAVAYILIGATCFAVLAARDATRHDPRFLGILLLATTFALVQKTSSLPAMILLLGLLWARDDWGGRIAALRVIRPSLALALGTIAVTTVRNFITTGCLAFPLGPSCLDVPWGVGRAAAEATLQGDRSWARNWGAGPLSAAGDFSWIHDWSSTYASSAAVRVVLVAAVVWFLTSMIAPVRHERERPPAIIFLFILVGGILWFIGAPDPRFGLHLHLVVAALLLRRGVGWAVGETRPLPTSHVRPFSISASLLLIAVVIVAGRLVQSGRTLPFASSTPADASEPLVTRSVAILEGIEAPPWEYFVRVGSDQCGAAFPCAPVALPDHVVVDSTGRRLRFERSID